MTKKSVSIRISYVKVEIRMFATLPFQRHSLTTAHHCRTTTYNVLARNWLARLNSNGTTEVV